MGPDAVRLSQPAAAAVSPCEAVVVVTIDGREHRTKAYLPDGLSPTQQDVSYSKSAVVKAIAAA